MTTMTHSHKMTDADAIRRFVLGGRATFTLKNARTGTRFTFKVAAKREKIEDGGAVVSPYWVKLMTGSDNEKSYSYVGYVYHRPDRTGYHEYRHGQQKAKVPFNTMPEAAFRWFWTLVNGRNMDGSERTDTVADYPDFEFWHEGSCCVCGRKLTVPESIASGIGPECAKRH